MHYYCKLKSLGRKAKVDISGYCSASNKNGIQFASGLVGAWKRGLQEAEGEYIVFADSDDWIEPNMLEKI